MIQVNTNGILCNYTEFALNAVSGDKCLVCTLVSAFYKHNSLVVSTDACPILPSNVGYLAGKSTNRISAEGLDLPASEKPPSASDLDSLRHKADSQISRQLSYKSLDFVP